jgi:hypothetical protein
MDTFVPGDYLFTTYLSSAGQYGSVWDTTQCHSQHVFCCAGAQVEPNACVKSLGNPQTDQLTDVAVRRHSLSTVDAGV